MNMIETLAKVWFVGAFVVWPFVNMAVRRVMADIKTVDYEDGIKIPISALPSWLPFMCMFIATTLFSVLWPITIPLGWPKLKQGVTSWFRGEL